MARSRRGGRGRGYGYGYAERETVALLPFRADLDIHTPFSADYGDLDATYLQILQTAEERGLAMIALTDHHSVGGVAAMRREVEDLTLLEELGRLSEEEAGILAEYRRLLDTLLVLPGFEFTAAYGFPILSVFPPETSVRRLEHVLMLLGVTEAEMDSGAVQIADAVDVLTAYEVIDEHGGLVIPARADTPQGVGQSGQYGIQTQIAYTQSPLIAALDVTDLDDTSRRGSAALYNGNRTDFSRHMHLIQTSDAHRLTGARGAGDLGIGERAMEFALPERSFAALRALFLSDDFSREQPYAAAPPVAASPLLAAREAGETITQAFHEQARSRRSGFRPLVKDAVAFANTKGGTLYVGLSANPAAPVAGVPLVEETLRSLRDSITRGIVPRLDVEIAVEDVAGKAVIVVRVPKGPDTPYATDTGQVFVRQAAETVVALRDEIVQLVRDAARTGDAPPAAVSERLWTAPRPAYSPEDEESDREGDAQDAQQEPPRLPLAAERIKPPVAVPAAAPRPLAPAPAPAPAPVPALVAPASAVPSEPIRRVLPPERRANAPASAVVAPPPSTPVVFAAPVAPVAPSAPAFVAPRLPNGVSTQIGTGVPAPIGVPVATAPAAKPANFVPFTRPTPPTPPISPPASVIAAPPVQEAAPMPAPTAVVPRTPDAVPPIPEIAVEPIVAPAMVEDAMDAEALATSDDATDATEEAEAEANRRRRPPRRRSRSRRGGADTEDGAESDTATVLDAEGSSTDAVTEPDAPLVYSLELPPVPEEPATPDPAPPVTIEATGEEVETTVSTAAAPDSAAEPAKPRRRRRSGGRGKAGAGETPDTTTAPDMPSQGDTVASATEQLATTAAEDVVPLPVATLMPEAGEATPPTSGVEILATIAGADGVQHYHLRDLKSGRELPDVTRKTARGHWRQAVLAREDRMPDEDKIVWSGARGYGRTVQRDGKPQYDFALRTAEGSSRIFYGVPDDDLDPAWRAAVPTP